MRLEGSAKPGHTALFVAMLALGVGEALAEALAEADGVGLGVTDARTPLTNIAAGLVPTQVYCVASVKNQHPCVCGHSPPATGQ